MIDAARKTLTRICCVMMVWLLAACAVSAPPKPASISPPEPGTTTDLGDTVAINLSQPITVQPRDPWSGPRTRLYTYVLVGDIGDGSANAAKQRARQALGHLLDEVQAGVYPGVGPNAPSLDMLRVANTFCIPARSTNPTPVTLETYDFALAAMYLNTFRAMLASSPQMSARLAGVGPFLVATKQPVGEMSSAGASTEPLVLVMDMSGRNPGTISEHVSHFKDAVRVNASAVGELNPMLPRVASLLMDLDKSIAIVTESYAGIRQPTR
ncbi:hypothetical protein ACQUJT_20345 [Ralstonia pseudosolanacearum]